VAQNVNISGIYLGNFADLNTFECNHATEIEASPPGT
jgi:hypothetical protein